MELLGTTDDVSGYAMNTSDGELALRLRSPAFNGKRGRAVWIISQGHGLWNEAQPHEADALERKWEAIGEAKDAPHRFANHY
jgi:hypothetical protein